MLAVVAPGSDVLGAVSPDEGSFSVLLAVFEVSLIASSIVPELNSATLNCSQSKFALIDFVYICKIVLALTLELSIDEFAFIVAAVCPFEAATTVLLALVELTHIPSATAIVAPYFLTLSMLSIHQPLSRVANSLASIIENSMTCGFVFRPLPHINILVCLSHLAPSREETVSELPLVLGTVRIKLDSNPVLLLCLQ